MELCSVATLKSGTGCDQSVRSKHPSDIRRLRFEAALGDEAHIHAKCSLTFRFQKQNSVEVVLFGHRLTLI